MALKDMLKTVTKDIVRGVTDAKDSLAEKNRRSAIVSRLRSVVKSEEARRDRAYMALGRYYYHNLRDENNESTELHCVAVDEAENRISGALAHMEELFRENSVKSPEVEEVDLSDVREIEPPVDTDPITEAANQQFIDVINEAAQDGENDNLPFE